MTFVARCPSVCWGTIGEDLLLFAPADRRLHVLNATAANVWMFADQPTDVAEIVEEFSNRYGLDREVIAGDVHELISNFLEAGLCVVGSVESDTLCLTDDPPPMSIPAGTEVIGPFSCLGIPLTIQTRDVLLRNELQRILGPLQTSDQETNARASMIHIEVRSYDGIWEIYTGGAIVSRTSTRGNALRTVLSECNAAPLRVIDSKVVFHSAGADLGSGIVLFPGVSNAGKSTLITQLTERGHKYLSDEAVAVHVDTLQAIPFPKAICLEEGSQDLFGHLAPRKSLTSTWDVDPRTIGPGRLSDGGLIAGMVFPTYSPGETTSIRPIESFEALELLLANAFDFGRVGQPGFSALVRMANALPAYALVHSGGTQHLDVLENLFAGSRALSL